MLPLLTNLKHFFFAKSESKKFLQLPAAERNIVFYSEDDFSYIHFEALIKQLINHHHCKVSYLTSQIDDPLLSNNTQGLKVFYIGSGLIRTALFMKLKAGLMIMTMPDIETFHIKRSKVADVHYVYLFHAMVSTHSNYRKGAFDHFDSIFLTGPYQAEEIRATESIYNLPKKSLVDYGYPRLESLLADIKSWRENKPPEKASNTLPQVIVAPSWGEFALLESMGVKLIQILLDANFIVTVRPHPVTTKTRPDIISELQKTFSGNKNFTCEIDIRDKANLYKADIMISDWSGVAMEYAFTCEKPVIFIDVPKKCNNPEANKINLIPIEASIRDKIGTIVSPENLENLPEVILHSIQNREQFTDDIIHLRKQYVFNLHSSVALGAEHINLLAPTASTGQQ